MRDGETLTEEKIESFIAMLSKYEPRGLETAFRRAAEECEWFPSVAEIRQRIPSDSQQRRIEQVQNRLHAAYKRAHDEGLLPAYPFRSLLVEGRKMLTDGGKLSRQERVRVGIEEPRELSPVEHDSRVAFLRAQASDLLATSGALNAGAGIGAGLV